MVRTHISSKGQTTIPAKLRALWNTAEVIWEENPDGSARVRPVPDIMSLQGCAKSDLPYDPEESLQGRSGWAATNRKAKGTS